MFKIALDGVWLIAGLGVAVLVGVFVAQYVKDKLKGVPAPLRAALSATESAALNELKAAQQKAIADVAGLLAKAKAAAKTDVSAVAEKVASATAAPAAPPAQPAAKA
jgi:hypothetical protein